MKVTRTMRRTLFDILRGTHLGEAYDRWSSAGNVSQHEAMLSRMADGGLIVWDHGVSDITLTDAGRAIATRVRTRRGG